MRTGYAGHAIGGTRPPERPESMCGYGKRRCFRSLVAGFVQLPSMVRISRVACMRPDALESSSAAPHLVDIAALCRPAKFDTEHHDENGQAHLALPAGAQRCAVAGRRARQQYARTGARADRPAGPVRRFHPAAAGAGRRQCRCLAHAPGTCAGGVAAGARSGRQHQHLRRPQPRTQPHRQAGAAARRCLHRQRAVRAGGTGGQGRRRRCAEGRRRG